MSNAFVIWLKARQAGMLAVASRDQFTPEQAAHFNRLESTLALYRVFEQDELVAVFDEQGLKSRREAKQAAKEERA